MMSKFKLGDKVVVNKEGKKFWSSVNLNQIFIVLNIEKVYNSYYEYLCIDRSWQKGHDGFAAGENADKDYPQSHWYFKDDQIDLFSSEGLTEEDMW